MDNPNASQDRLNSDMEDEPKRLQFADVRSRPLRPKATLHTSGKLGFNSDASEYMDLTGNETFAVAFDPDHGPDHDLYLVSPDRDTPEEACLQVSTAGEYFQLNLKNFYERYNINYGRYKFIYDIEELGDDRRDGYRLNRREDVKVRD